LQEVVAVVGEQVPLLLQEPDLVVVQMVQILEQVDQEQLTQVVEEVDLHHNQLVDQVELEALV
tara:strand:- start:35 stop:223 length:189 start_codon:yes stop_codon:yes gene_type:complete